MVAAAMAAAGLAAATEAAVTAAAGLEGATGAAARAAVVRGATRAADDRHTPKCGCECAMDLRPA